MSWAKYDDGFDDSGKVRRALREGIMGLAAIGLHTLSVTQSARRETDGRVDLDWLDEKLHRISARDRQRLMDLMTDVGFFEALPVGEQRELTDTKGFTVTVGPLEEPAHIVHDYLDYNDSSAYMEEKRRRDSKRKTSGVRKDSERIPSGSHAESDRIPPEPRARGRVPDPTRPDPTRPSPPTPPARGVLAMTIAEVETVLAQCSRLHVDRVGLENAVGSWPGRDPVQAARTVVTWATDPAFRTTNAAKLLGDALSKQPAPATRPDGGDPDLAKYDRAVGLA